MARTVLCYPAVLLVCRIVTADQFAHLFVWPTPTGLETGKAVAHGSPSAKNNAFAFTRFARHAFLVALVWLTQGKGQILSCPKEKLHLFVSLRRLFEKVNFRSLTAVIYVNPCGFEKAEAKTCATSELGSSVPCLLLWNLEWILLRDAGWNLWLSLERTTDLCLDFLHPWCFMMNSETRWTCVRGGWPAAMFSPLQTHRSHRRPVTQRECVIRLTAQTSSRAKSLGGVTN